MAGKNGPGMKYAGPSSPHRLSTLGCAAETVLCHDRTKLRSPQSPCIKFYFSPNNILKVSKLPPYKNPAMALTRRKRALIADSGQGVSSLKFNCVVTDFSDRFSTGGCTTTSIEYPMVVIGESDLMGSILKIDMHTLASALL